ncbi:MAG: flagellar biosynthetic protein FliR [Hydrogenophilales bacterium 28-61-23]|nr:MAG: flagellar biosynthetic protein FliR [Hydrogenophilales bacterium 28-61-23]
MFTLSSADLDAMLALFFFPFVRILAWLSFDPLLGNKGVPTQVRVALAMLIAMVVTPILPTDTPLRLASGDGVLILLQQIAIGAALGFSLRIVFSTIEFAGQLIGLQMGLSFATLFDPVNGAQTQVVAQFLTLSTVLILLAFNGHHLVITALVVSFQEIPIGSTLSAGGFAMLAGWGGTLFAVGLHISLPVTAALLVTNLTIGMMSRASPQLNIFAIGFPLTLGMGFLVLFLALAYLPAQLDQFWRQAVEIGARAMLAVTGR